MMENVACLAGELGLLRINWDYIFAVFSARPSKAQADELTVRELTLWWHERTERGAFDHVHRPVGVSQLRLGGAPLWQ